MNQELTSLRLQLRAAGFSPLPLNGKAPSSVKAWQTKFDVTADEIALWEKLYPFDTNTGVLTRLTPVIDIDILNREAADAVEALARERFEERGYFLVRIGQPPKRAIPLRTDAPFPKITGNITAPTGIEEKIEFLCDGQQCVAFGIHPATKHPYAWHGGELGKIKHEELPYIGESEARAFIDDAMQLLIEYGYSRRGPDAKAQANATADDSAEWPALIDKILAGTDLHASIASLAINLLKAGLHDGATVRLLRTIMRTSQAPHDRRWQERYDDISRAVRTAREKVGDGSEEQEIILHWHGDMQSAAPRRAWLIDGLLPEAGTGLMSGQWGTYKTFVGLDLAIAVMAGLAFIDYPVVRRGGVLFVAAEGASEIPIRLQAVLIDKYPETERLPFCWIEDCPRLVEPRTINKLAGIASQATARMQTEFGVPLALIVIDTIADSAGYTKPGDENDAAINQLIMNRLATLSGLTGAMVIGIDHFGKAVETGTRGSSAKEARADVVLALLGDKAVSGEVSNTRIAIRKNRAGPSGREVPFSTRVVDLGTERNGKQTTSLVIDWGTQEESTPTKNQDAAWSKSLRLLRRALMNVLASDAAADHQPFPDGPTVRAVDIEIVRAEFYKSYSAEGTPVQKQAARRQAFNRAITAAQEKDLVGIREVDGITLIWLARSDPAQNA
jgi:hypothetical protein